jgi:hypothetical protein
MRIERSMPGSLSQSAPATVEFRDYQMINNEWNRFYNENAPVSGNLLRSSEFLQRCFPMTYRIPSEVIAHLEHVSDIAALSGMSARVSEVMPPILKETEFRNQKTSEGTAGNRSLTWSKDGIKVR